MRAYPDTRAAKPRKWYWLVGVVPAVQIWAHEVHIGFWRQAKYQGQFNPVMRKPFVKLNRFGVTVIR